MLTLTKSDIVDMLLRPFAGSWPNEIFDRVRAKYMEKPDRELSQKLGENINAEVIRINCNEFAIIY